LTLWERALALCACGGVRGRAWPALSCERRGAGGGLALAERLEAVVRSGLLGTLCAILALALVSRLRAARKRIVVVATILRVVSRLLLRLLRGLRRARTTILAEAAGAAVVPAALGAEPTDVRRRRRVLIIRR